MTPNELLNRGLPKWPQMYTTGRPVTENQAKEIIRRTDTFIVNGFGGNDRKWDDAMAKRLRMPHYLHGDKKPSTEPWQAYWDRCDTWRKKWGAIETEYVHNAWLSNAYIYGPNGWCHPDGRIGFVDNVGKWPSVEDVLRDWARLAAEFPYLELAATLMDREFCEEMPIGVVTILVAQGYATVVSPDMRYHEAHDAPNIDRSDDAMRRRFARGVNSAEHGPIPEKWFAEWESNALAVDAQMRSWVYMPEDVEHDLGDVDDGWKKELERQREGL